jgi:hypothetical protein
MTALVNDVGRAARVLRRQPGFGVSAVATIALAIAANTLMFAVVRGVLFNPLPLPEPNRLVRVEQVQRTGPSNVTGATFADLHTTSKSLATVAAFRMAPASLSVGDVRQAAPDAAARPAVYYPLDQFPQTTLTQTLIVRTREPLARVDDEIRRAVREIDPSQPVARVSPMPEHVAVVLSPRRFNLTVLGAFASAALLLASVGIYGLVAFAVASRTREIGVRVALGATPRRIAAFAISSGALPVAGGLVLGLARAALASRALEGLVFGVSRFDAISFVGAALLSSSVALAAVAGPARRAMRVDPIIALLAD